MNRVPIPADAVGIQVEDLSTAVDGLLDAVLTHFPDPVHTPPDIFEAIMRLERARGVTAVQKATEQLWLKGFERPPGHVAISLERHHQVVARGYTLEHDRRHSNELVAAAVWLLTNGQYSTWPFPETEEHVSTDYDADRRLVAAGAFVAAEYDRIGPA